MTQRRIRPLRATVSVSAEADSVMEARRLADFMFERCPGNVAEGATVEFLRRIRSEAARHPGTGAAHHSQQIKALMAALMT